MKNGKTKKLLEQLNAAIVIREYIINIADNDKGDVEAQNALKFNTHTIQNLIDCINDMI